MDHPLPCPSHAACRTAEGELQALCAAHAEALAALVAKTSGAAASGPQIPIGASAVLVSLPRLATHLDATTWLCLRTAIEEGLIVPLQVRPGGYTTAQRVAATEGFERRLGEYLATWQPDEASHIVCEALL